MSGKATYHDGVLVQHEGTLGAARQLSPVEELMELEEGVEMPVELSKNGWMIGMVLEMVFADEQPMDWRYAGRRGLILLRAFAPGVLSGRPQEQVRELEGLALPGNFPPGTLEELVMDAESREVLRKFLMWVYPTPAGRQWVKEGTRALYVLARGFHAHSLKKLVPGKTVRGKWVEERMEDMTYHDFAIAFGEKAGKGARARWCWRGKQILPATVHVPFQKGRQMVEMSRQRARGNKHRAMAKRREREGKE
jgi:hypothetical protein